MMAMDNPLQLLERCEVCPRRCRVNRLKGERGACRVGDKAVIAHYGPHFGEEPPITGTKGSGNVFFSSCNLRCIYCQNHQISHSARGREVTVPELKDLFLEVQAMGVHNLNLVSPTPYGPLIAAALHEARQEGLAIPVVYNTNGYESVETLELLRGLVQVYLPDFKYWNQRVGARLSRVDDYPDHARRALAAMKEQVGDLILEDGMAVRGILIRHLVLPGGLAGSRQVILWIREHLGASTFLSLMSQYMPLFMADQYPLLTRRITSAEYDDLVGLLVREGFENVYIQDLESAPLFVPDFRGPRPFGPAPSSGTSFNSSTGG